MKLQKMSTRTRKSILSGAIVFPITTLFTKLMCENVLLSLNGC